MSQKPKPPKRNQTAEKLISIKNKISPEDNSGNRMFHKRERPSRHYCINGLLEEGEERKEKLHLHGRYKVDDNGFVYDDKNNLIENSLEEAIRQRCRNGKNNFYTEGEIQSMINEAKNIKEEPLKLEDVTENETKGGKKTKKNNKRKRKTLKKRNVKK